MIYDPTVMWLVPVMQSCHMQY